VLLNSSGPPPTVLQGLECWPPAWARQSAPSLRTRVVHKMGFSLPPLLVLPLANDLPSLLFLLHGPLLCVAMGIPCRFVCGRILATVLGEQRNASHVHRAQKGSPVLSPPGRISAICVDSEDSDTVTSTRTTNKWAGCDTALKEDGVRHVLGMESQVFMELSRMMTAPPPSQTRRCHDRRSALSERAMRSRRNDAQSHRNLR